MISINSRKQRRRERKTVEPLYKDHLSKDVRWSIKTVDSNIFGLLTHIWRIKGQLYLVNTCRLRPIFHLFQVVLKEGFATGGWHVSTSCVGVQVKILTPVRNILQHIFYFIAHSEISETICSESRTVTKDSSKFHVFEYTFEQRLQWNLQWETPDETDLWWETNFLQQLDLSDIVKYTSDERPPLLKDPFCWHSVWSLNTGFTVPLNKH